MTFERQETLKDGQMLTLRSLVARDAAAAIFIMRKTAGETRFLMRETSECGMTIAQEQEFIARMRQREREILLGAFIEDELVGMANLTQVSLRLRVRHRAQAGICVVRAHWGKGVGTAMMRALVDCAKTAGYEQLELEAVENNDRAAALYRRLGFKIVGKMPRAIKYPDGGYADLLFMCLRLDCAHDEEIAP